MSETCLENERVNGQSGRLCKGRPLEPPLAHEHWVGVWVVWSLIRIQIIGHYLTFLYCNATHKKLKMFLAIINILFPGRETSHGI